MEHYNKSFSITKYNYILKPFINNYFVTKFMPAL